MSTSSAPADGGLRPTAVAGVPLAALAALAGSDAGTGPAGPADLLVTGITLRAQAVRPGDLFAALPGSRVHGAVFVHDAIRAGATCVVTDRPGAAAIGPDPAVPVLVVDDARAVLGTLSSRIYGDPSRSLAVIGVTGTSGKTTTGYLLEAALAGPDHRIGLVGTVQTRIDGTPSKSLLTTPEAPDLQALFAVMVERGVDTVAMEVSSHALSLGRVAGTHFDVGAFTNLSQDHLDFHPDMESYFQAKAMLFDGRARAGVINIDDGYGRRLADRHPDAVTVSTTGGRSADWTVTDVRASGAGHQQFTAHRPDGPALAVELALPGHFNVANALVALACVSAAGRDVERAAAAMGTVVVPGRMERVDAGQGFLVVVDYAHKPAALSAVLEAIAPGVTGRLIVVVGAGGDRDAAKRPMMGAVAATLADTLIVTDDNPRSESPAVIRSAILAGARGAHDRSRPGAVTISEIGDRQEAIASAIAAARPGDAVVIAGKGHEQGQDVGGVIHPFSDRREALSVLSRLGHRSPEHRTAPHQEEGRNR